MNRLKTIPGIAIQYFLNTMSRLELICVPIWNKSPKSDEEERQHERKKITFGSNEAKMINYH